MIRRLWRWLMQDDPDHLLREAAKNLAAEMNNLSRGQQLDLLGRYPDLWRHATRVAACVEMRSDGIT